MPRSEKPYAMKKKATALGLLRIEAGFKQGAAAEQLGIHATSLSNIERGAVPASEELLDRMAELYKRSRLTVERAYRDGRRHQFQVREGL